MDSINVIETSYFGFYVTLMVFGLITFIFEMKEPLNCRFPTPVLLSQESNI